ncbi:TonB-dependent receptor [uncultured Ruminobacter sp.]|uniref:TonB-dependent receptor n=1 Tax=uncultured Ruminobacter sp. TaxID=538947 RepID=UPI0025FD4B1E|nr:TonB-dependent receptor [uncultured Ruminobacter sp.]
MYGNRKTCRFMMTLLASSIMTAVNAYAAEEEYDFELDTISVTANKYSQDLVSLSGQAEVADDKTLEEHEVRGVTDLTKISSALTPAVGFGSRQLTKYTVRGINSGNIYNSGVTVYVDGVAQPFSQMNQQFNDVSTVEILKGPQGSVYGSGAQLGIINITSKNPMLDGNYADVESDYSKLYWKNRVAAGGALYEDKIYGKFGVSNQKDYGWIKDIDGSNYNTGESYAVNGALYFSGGENSPLNVTVGGSYTKDRGHQSNVALTESEYRNERISGHGIIRNPDFTRSYLAGAMSADPGVIEYFGSQEAAYEALYNSGEIRDIINPKEERTAYTAYVKLDYYRDNGDSVNSITSLNSSDSCELYMMGQGSCGNNEIKTRQFTQEIRYVSELGHAGDVYDSGKAVIGVNVTNSTTDNYVLAQVDISDNEMYQALTGATVFPIGQVDVRVDDLSFSAFTDYAYNFGVGASSIFDIDLGLRYEHARSKANGNYMFGYDFDHLQNDYDMLDYKAAFGYTFVTGHRAYVLASSGSKAGGFSKFPTSALDEQGYDPEKTYNYEAGYHMSLDNGFDANAALFFMDVHNRQAYTVVENSYMTPLRNIGRMHSKGAELTLGYRAERVSTGVSMTYADSRNETSGYTRHPGNAPKFVAAGLIDVTALKFADFAAHVGGNMRYQSKTYFGEGYTSVYENSGLIQESQGGYTVFDLYASAEIMKNLEIKAYVENVADKKYAASIDNGSNYGVRFYSMAAPRNVGVKLKYSF